MNILHVIDIETNNISGRLGDILEVGYIRIDNNLNILGYGVQCLWEDRFYDDAWSVGRTDIHGLTKEYLQDNGKGEAEMVTLLYNLVNRALVVGKNSTSFDIPFIKQYISRKCYELNGFEPENTVDVQTIMAEDFRADYFKKYNQKTRKVGDLMEQCLIAGITPEDIDKFCIEKLNMEKSRTRYHSALYDAAATYLLLCHIVRVKGLSIKC